MSRIKLEMQDGGLVKFDSKVTIKCGFCDGSFALGYLGSNNDEAGMHTIPICLQFEELSLFEFIVESLAIHETQDSKVKN